VRGETLRYFVNESEVDSGIFYEIFREQVPDWLLEAASKLLKKNG
jgi:hypothetical protein